MGGAGLEKWKVGEPWKTAIDERAAHSIDRSHDLPFRKFVKPKRHCVALAIDPVNVL